MVLLTKKRSPCFMGDLRVHELPLKAPVGMIVDFWVSFPSCQILMVKVSPSLQILLVLDDSWPALQSQSVIITISLTGALIKGQEIVFFYQLRLVSWFVFCICYGCCLYSGYSNEDLSVTWIQHLILCNLFLPQYYTFLYFFFLQWTREKKGFNYSFTINLWN